MTTGRSEDPATAEAFDQPNTGPHIVPGLDEETVDDELDGDNEAANEFALSIYSVCEAAIQEDGLRRTQVSIAFDSFRQEVENATAGCVGPDPFALQKLMDKRDAREPTTQMDTVHQRFTDALREAVEDDGLGHHTIRRGINDYALLLRYYLDTASE